MKFNISINFNKYLISMSIILYINFILDHLHQDYIILIIFILIYKFILIKFYLINQYHQNF